MVLCTLLVTAQQKPVVKAKQTKASDSTQHSSAGKIFGVIISDLNYLLQEPQAAPNQNKGTGGDNSFDIRRLHLGYEHTFSKELSARVIYDPAVDSLQEAYLLWKNVFSMHSLTIGMMHTLAEKTSEKYFEYRSLGQLVMDKKGFSQEFDRGISLTGNFDPQGSVYYSFMVGNGSGMSPELNKVKKFYFTFGLMPDKGSVAELYLDYENFTFGRSAITAKFLYAMMAKTYAFGLDGFYRMNRKFAGTKDIVPAGGSIFSWVEMMSSTRAVARIDVIDDDLNNSGNNVASPSYREVYANVGLDYLPIPEVHLIPNIAYVMQMKKNKGPDIAEYMLARLTVAVYFK